MTDTFRALCAELTYCWSRTTNPDDFAENAAPIIGRMRAALRAVRRPKPPSLKEQALELAKPAGTEGAYVTFGPEELALIRRALEALPDD